MCGIFGFTFDFKSPELELKKMGNAMIHRGPDGEGYYTDSNIGMGMRRLSIIDLETGDQPFFNNDKSVVAFCNGEIYNYQELRIELQKKGYSFRSKSDIEVLQSEEGGRFYQESNQNIILLGDDSFPIEEPPGFLWMTISQLKHFIKCNNLVNVEARSLIACLSTI